MNKIVPLLLGVSLIFSLTGCGRQEQPAAGTTVQFLAPTTGGKKLPLAAVEVKVVAREQLVQILTDTIAAGQHLPRGIPESMHDEFFQNLAPAKMFQTLRTDADGKAAFPQLPLDHLLAVRAAQQDPTGRESTLWVGLALLAEGGTLQLDGPNLVGPQAQEAWAVDQQFSAQLAAQLRGKAEEALNREELASARHLAKNAQLLADPGKADALLEVIDQQAADSLVQQGEEALDRRDYETARQSAQQALGIVPDHQGARDLNDQILDEEGGQISVFTGHTEPVTSVRFSPEGELAFSSSADGTVWLWDVFAGEVVQVFDGHRAPVSDIAVSPDGQHLLSGGVDGTMRLWNVASGQEIRLFEGLGWKVTCVAISPDGRYVASGGDDNKAKLWDISTGKTVRDFSGHGWKLTRLAFSPDGQRLLSASEDDTMRLWDTDTGKEIRTFRHGLANVNCVAFSSDGRRALSGTQDGKIRLWDLDTGKELKVLAKLSHPVNSLTISPDDRVAVCGCGDGSIKLWNLETGQEIRSYRGHEGAVTGVAFDPLGPNVLSGAEDKSVRLWRLPKDARTAAEPAAK